MFFFYSETLQFCLHLNSWSSEIENVKRNWQLIQIVFRHCFLAIPYLYQTCYLLHYLCGFCWMCCFIITVKISEENDQWVPWAEHRNVYICDMWIALRVLWSFCLQNRLELKVNLIKPTKAHEAINRLELKVNLIKPTKAHKASA